MKLTFNEIQEEINENEYLKMFECLNKKEVLLLSKASLLSKVEIKELMTLKGLPFLCNLVNWMAKTQDEMFYDIKTRIIKVLNSELYKESVPEYDIWFNSGIFYVNLNIDYLQVSFHVFEECFYGSENHKTKDGFFRCWTGEPTQENAVELCEMFISKDIPSQKERGFYKDDNE